MITRKCAYKKAALLISIISIMSMSLISCGSNADTSNNKDTSVSESSDESSSETVTNYVQDELSEDEKVKVYLFSSDKYYHINKDCEAIKHKDEEEKSTSADAAADDDDKYMTLVKKAAENCGYLPCPKCAGGTEEDDSSK